MSKWEKVKLGDIVDSCLGKMLDAKKNKGDYHQYLANINVRWGDFDLTNLSLMRFELSEAERYGIKDGDLIICEGGEPGRCAIWRDQLPNMKIQKALHRVRPKNGLDIRFLYYWFLLAGKTERIDRYFTGSTIKHLPGDNLAEIEIDLPTINNQKAIATILDNIDRKISLNNAINAELEKIAKLLYDYWFVQFDFPNIEGKPYRTSGGEMVYNEQLKRNIPKGWEVASIKDMTYACRGVSYDKDDILSDSKDGVLVLRGNNIQDNRLVYDNNMVFIPDRFISDEQRIRKHDIILTMSSGSKEHIGKCTMFQYDSPHTFGAFL